RVSQAIAGTLRFFENDLYKDGLLYHDWSQDKRALDFCTGCNFFALSVIQESKPSKYKGFLPFVVSGASAQSAQAVTRQTLSYNEWNKRFSSESTEAHIKEVLSDPVSLLSDQEKLREGLDLLK
ncbi:hypothetical protein COT50_01930, partial [candidate division WWE3 bacterium CG08_land_8_20_14_0_20_41_10]